MRLPAKHSPRKPSIAMRIRYVFDDLLSRGPIGLLVISVAGSALITLALTPIFWFIDGIATGDWHIDNFVMIFWTAFIGLFKAGDGQGPWMDQLSHLVFAIIAIFFTGIVFGSMLKMVGQKFVKLRQQGGPILSSDHTVIVGWSALGFEILTELGIANENQGKSAVVVLAPQDKVKLEESIAGLPMRTTKTIVRNGKPTSLDDLDRVRLNTARNVIVLGQWDSPDHDSQVIASLMAIARYRETHSEFRAEVVACLRHDENELPAKVAARYPVTILNVRSMLARVMLQVSRQPGLFVVLTELMQFANDEIYFAPVPAQFVGSEFGDIAKWYPASTPIGIVRDGVPTLHPGGNIPVEASDQLIVITEDDDTAVAANRPATADESAIVDIEPFAIVHDAERWLFVGWASTVPDVLKQLDEYLIGARNEVTIIVRDDDLKKVAQLDSLDLPNVDITILEWPDAVPARAMLDTVDVCSQTYVVIPGHAGEADADSDTLLTLLHVRDIIDSGVESGKPEPFIVSELLDDKYRKIAHVSERRDIVVSSELVSLMLAQLAENPGLYGVFQELFDAPGSEIYLKPARYYVELNTELNFMTVVEAARRRGEIAIGYRLDAEVENKKKRFGVNVNPAKDSAVNLCEADMVIVVAAHEGMTEAEQVPEVHCPVVVSSALR